jgi:hypothetical protein
MERLGQLYGKRGKRPRKQAMTKSSLSLIAQEALEYKLYHVVCLPEASELGFLVLAKSVAGCLGEHLGLPVLAD